MLHKVGIDDCPKMCVTMKSVKSPAPVEVGK